MVRTRCVDSFFKIWNDDVEKLKKKIGEDEERLQHIEDLLNQWIQCQLHLPKNYDRNMARNFIRGSKFNLEITKRRLEGYFFAKYAFPEFYRGRNPNSKDIIQVFDTINIVWLPKLTENGEKVCVLSLANPDPLVFNITWVSRIFTMLYDLTLTCKFPIVSEIWIFDCTNITSNHLMKFLSTTFKNSLSVLRYAYASRVSQIHFVNCPAMVEKVASALRPLLHEKLRERLIIHRGTNSLVDYLQPKVLPAELGGSLGSLNSFKKQWWEVMSENSEWFQEQEDVNIIGKPPKRIHKFTNNIGLEGSFRQLNID